MKLITAALILAAVPASAQNTTDLPSFEVVSIKPNADPVPPLRQTLADQERNFAGRTARISLRGVMLKLVLVRAFDVRWDDVIGPGWLDDSRPEVYDIEAIAPGGPPGDKIRLMLEKMLADRFKLKYHWETRVVPVYALVVAEGGPKMQPGITDDDPFAIGRLSESKGTFTARWYAAGKYTMTVEQNRWKFDLENVSMKDFALALSSRFPIPPMLDLPVLDQTSLPGQYQVHLDLSVADIRPSMTPEMPSSSPDTATGMPNPSDPSGSGTSLRDSLEKLGLKLVRQRAPVEKLVIDAIERTPTEN